VFAHDVHAWCSYAAGDSMPRSLGDAKRRCAELGSYLCTSVVCDVYDDCTVRSGMVAYSSAWGETLHCLPPDDESEVFGGRFPCGKPTVEGGGDLGVAAGEAEGGAGGGFNHGPRGRSQFSSAFQHPSDHVEALISQSQPIPLDGSLAEGDSTDDGADVDRNGHRPPPPPETPQIDADMGDVIASAAADAIAGAAAASAQADVERRLAELMKLGVITQEE
jgi:hypothetical protein